ncbi:hypothetical protein VTJ04DRAFT_4416 [Mycothermus thermophilus]|uniref:uncharacterized protein n=1 Tax=Humicola insolens TaxID=85995 RepID=UPI0037437AFF
MTSLLDPETNQPLPDDAIIRVLHITPRVHVYALPRDAIATSKGYTASTWTADPRNPIFTGRLRVLETSYSSEPNSQPDQPSQPQPNQQDDPDQTVIKVSILLEDPTTGALFAACPYDTPLAVQPAADSSRFFALRVRDPTTKQKATLGIGFEERAEAFDFGVALQEAGRGLAGVGVAAFASLYNTPSGGGGGTAAAGGIQKDGKGGLAGGNGGEGGGGKGDEGARDWSLKEDETITVKLSGTRFGRRVASGGDGGGGGDEKKDAGGGGGGDGGGSLAAFALPPPPPAPSAARSAREKRLSAQSAKELGFDDGQFGEFA